MQLQTRLFAGLMLFTAALLIASCSNDKPVKQAAAAARKDFLVTGTIRGRDSSWVYFSAVEKNFKVMDSAKVVGGQFELRGQTTYPTPYYVGVKEIRNGKYVGARTFSSTVIIDTGHLEISAQIDSMRNLHATGTAAQEEYSAFKKQLDPLLQRGNDIFGEIYETKKSNTRRLDSLGKVQNQAEAAIEQAVLAHARKYRSAVSAFVINYYMAQSESSLLVPIAKMLSPEAMQSPYGIKLASLVNSAVITGLGHLAPVFDVPDVAGKPISPASYKGKIVLVDFWASWCAPCRAENPNLLKAYKSYHNKGFEILSVSMDKSRENWLEAVKQDQLPWTQVSDLKGNDSPLTELYGIRSIPMNFLLDKEGKIIARNLRGGELKAKLGDVMR